MKTSRPLVLALDSAGSACSAAVAVGEDILAAERIDTLHGQAEALMPLVDTAMRRAGLPPAALDLVVTTVGPGSFTGIRVGIAAARGIALAADAQLVGVTSFEAVAAESGAPGCEHPNFLLVTLESRREDLFVQIFDRLRNPVGEPTAVAPADLGELVNATAAAVPLLVAGDAVQRALPLLTKPPGTCLLEIRTPLAVGALRAALRLRLSGGGREARPLYLRPPDTTTSNVRRTVGPAE
jgi:tRNA threonylcarbamoyladenosine biosynthesis protein TsaB